MKTIELTLDNFTKAHEAAINGASLPEVLTTLIGCKPVVDNRPITERIITLDHVFAYHSTTSEAFYAACEAIELPSDEIGYRLSKLVTSALNEGWVPDFSNGETKWEVIMEFVPGAGFRFVISYYSIQGSSVGSRLCFKDKARCDHYGKTFAPVINQFFL